MNFSFRKTLISLATILALTLSHSAAADQYSNKDDTNYKKWVGVFGQYYHPDGDKPDEIGGGFMEHGAAFGGEFGVRFTPRWAMRLEASKTGVNAQTNAFGTDAVDGTKFAADALYFQDDEQTYLFSGLHHANDDFDDYLSVAVGIGKHWNLDESTRIITEATAYHAFADSYNDFSLKIGLAWVWGQVDASAAALDSDRDGVIDRLDNCPRTAPGVSVDARGCNLDTDNDGIANSLDNCPNSARGATVNASGCAAKDSDNDGIIDSMDLCMNTPAGDTVTTTGCSVMVQEQIEVTLSALFANNSSIIQNPSDVKFVEFADFLKRYPDATGIIEGHTSSVGTDQYNQFLSQRRADAVKALLVSRYNAPAERISTVGYGEKRLLNPANNAAAHRENRRIIGIVKAVVETNAK